VPIYALGDRVPEIHPDAYVHPDAVVIGDVRIGAESSIWPTAVLRGDYGTIIVGERTSIQDGAVIHAVDEYPTVIGDDCVIGHLAHLEGCVIHDQALIGSGSIVLHQAVVNSGATVGAGAVVRNRVEVPSNAMALGVPAAIKLDSCNAAVTVASAALYVQNARRYRAVLRKL
jgi:carbonic anhydrase/acetyltransferase-like protein (isoleucine patch superfamily)